MSMFAVLFARLTSVSYDSLPARVRKLAAKPSSLLDVDLFETKNEESYYYDATGERRLILRDRVIVTLTLKACCFIGSKSSTLRIRVVRTFSNGKYIVDAGTALGSFAGIADIEPAKATQVLDELARYTKLVARVRVQGSE